VTARPGGRGRKRQRKVAIVGQETWRTHVLLINSRSPEDSLEKIGIIEIAWPQLCKSWMPQGSDIHVAHASRCRVCPRLRPRSCRRSREIVVTEFAPVSILSCGFRREHYKPHTRTPPAGASPCHLGTISASSSGRPPRRPPRHAGEVKPAQENGCATPSSSRRRSTAATVPPSLRLAAAAFPFSSASNKRHQLGPRPVGDCHGWPPPPGARHAPPPRRRVKGQPQPATPSPLSCPARSHALTPPLGAAQSQPTTPAGHDASSRGPPLAAAAVWPGGQAAASAPAPPPPPPPVQHGFSSAGPSFSARLEGRRQQLWQAPPGRPPPLVWQK